MLENIKENVFAANTYIGHLSREIETMDSLDILELKNKKLKFKNIIQWAWWENTDSSRKSVSMKGE